MKVSRASSHTADGSLPSRSVDPTPPSGEVARVPSLRSIAPTLPAPPEQRREAVPFDPFLMEVLAAREAAPPVSGRRRRRRREWCVDHGARIDTMTTFELWVAIASREVAADIRVWREGMECWTPVKQLPELACAVNDPLAIEPGLEGTGPLCTDPAPAPAADATPTVPRATIRSSAETLPQDGWARARALDAARASGAGTRRADAIGRRSVRVAQRPLLDFAPDEPLNLEVPAVAMRSASQAFVRRELEPSPAESEADPAMAVPSSPVARRRTLAGGARWVAAGTAFAILAIGVASLASPSRAAAPAVARSIAPVVPVVASDAVDRAAPVLDWRPSRPDARHRDHGQRRRRER